MSDQGANTGAGYEARIERFNPFAGHDRHFNRDDGCRLTEMPA